MDVSDAFLSQLKETLLQVNEQKQKGLAATISIKRDGLSAKVYSMGENNPITRIDIREVS